MFSRPPEVAASLLLLSEMGISAKLGQPLPDCLALTQDSQGPSLGGAMPARRRLNQRQTKCSRMRGGAWAHPWLSPTA